MEIIFDDRPLKYNPRYRFGYRELKKKIFQTGIQKKVINMLWISINYNGQNRYNSALNIYIFTCSEYLLYLIHSS